MLGLTVGIPDKDGLPEGLVLGLRLSIEDGLPDDTDGNAEGLLLELKAGIPDGLPVIDGAVEGFSLG